MNITLYRIISYYAGALAVGPQTENGESEGLLTEAKS